MNNVQTQNFADQQNKFKRFKTISNNLKQS